MTSNDKYIFFWGGIYSNWYPCKLNIFGTDYNCVEQYMMAWKALHFQDKVTYDLIMAEPDPRKQKALGRKVKNFDPKHWERFCRGIVYEAVLCKFSDPVLKAELLATGDKEIVEASPYDKIWGIGLGEDNPLIWDKANWQGTNWLGEAIMAVREDLRNGIEHEA